MSIRHASAHAVRVKYQPAALILAVAVVFGGLAACGPRNDAAAPPSTATPVEAAAADPTTAGPTTEPSPSASSAPAVENTPVVEKRTVRVTKSIPYGTRTVKDPSRAAGTKSVRVTGVAGARTLTYQVTLTDGVETGRKLVRSAVTRRPITKVIVLGTKPASTCDPNYSGQCVPIASDVDCGGGSGNGPAYVYGAVKVVGDDIYDLDRDGDGIGCDK